ncbi:MAG: pyridine nucleotide-disulfide oxidoreductase, partial [Nitrospirota bacterium]
MNRTPATQDAPALKLGIAGFSYADLYEPAKLKELSDLFYADVKKADSELFAAFDAYRKKKGEGVAPTETSDLLCRMGIHLDRFVVRLFGIEEGAARLRKEIGRLCLLFPFKNDFVLRRVLKKYKPADAAEMDFRALDKMASALQRAVFPAETPDEDQEITAGRMVSALLSIEREFVREAQKLENDAAGARKRLSEIRGKLGQHAEAKHLLAGLIQPAPQAADQEKVFLGGLMELIERWAYSATQDPAGREKIKGWVSFHAPEKMDFTRLVEFHRTDPGMPEAMEGPTETRRRRDGFKLTDRRFDRKKALAEIDYCVFCHDRDKDSCCKGYVDKKGARVKNPVGIVLDGCPLREKISEAHWLKKQGDSIAALAMIAIDNPMVPGTGHRICNDCMKACIYQKQEPVNIPQAETRILTDVLDLPWGLEIYGLLTRW